VILAAELATLARLRERFLTGQATGGAYWRTEVELALYDATFAERIGWKWDAVLEDLDLRHWQPRARHIIDFGCGTGVAHRRVLKKWAQFETVSLVDVSPLALRFASTKTAKEFPQVALKTGHEVAPGTLLLVSHVLNELDSEARARLLSLARKADEVIWLEAGTHADSRSLISVREELRSLFSIIAPCPHGAPCGMLAAENARHWCHHFARVPSWAFQDPGWAQFSRELNIDLTTLPYSYLVLSKAAIAMGERNTRIIGRPREAKGRMEILACRAEGVRDVMLQKRDAPELFKALRKERADSLQQWVLEAGKIVPSPRESNATNCGDDV
jgi:ribosomal protein RSM22 (predicted rRNA methylase)